MLSKLLCDRLSCDNIKNTFIEVKKPTITKPSISLFYNDYFKNKTILKKYKLNELKQIAKVNKLRISGTKSNLIERIEEVFNKCIKCVKIQKTFRGYIVKKSFTMRGEGYKNPKICVNENDFYTLEPLHEIPIEYFFTFKSNDDKFVFGCNIVSLLHLLKNKTAVKNPYNRETIKIEVIQTILKLYNIIKIIYAVPEDAPIMNTNMIMNIHNNINDNRIIRESIQRPHGNTVTLSNEIINDRTLKITTMRSKPIHTRIQELFMDIDQLGNYTNYQWFLDLERRDFIRLYRTLHDIWTYRGHLSREMKCKICILEDPFHEIHRERLHFHEASIDVIREVCLKIIENMVYCGIDDEYRKIGTLHALSALTMVSTSARNAMPWLYESLYP
jgi:hypothetical protein